MVRPAFAARWMDSVREDLMLIRITYWDKCLDEQKVIEGTDFIVPLTGYPKVSYTGKKQELRILCGSI